MGARACARVCVCIYNYIHADIIFRGETPKSTIQGIVSSSRKTSRTLNLVDPFVIDKNGPQKQTRYKLSDEFVGDAKLPKTKEVPDDPVIILPVLPYSDISYSGKRQRKAPELYTPTENLKISSRPRKRKPKKPKHKAVEEVIEEIASTESQSQSEVDVEEVESLEEPTSLVIQEADDDTA